MSEEKPIRNIVAENLGELRKARGLTQIQLAEIMGYSDKSVSKWERGDAIPDIETLYNLASYYGVTIDDLCSDGMAKNKVASNEKKKGINVWAIAGLCCMAVIVVFINLYIVLLNNTGFNHWSFFTWWIPVDAVILFVFNCIWGPKKYRPIFGSIMAWAIPLGIYLELGCSTENGWSMWTIMLLGIPLMIMAILWDKIVSH